MKCLLLSLVVVGTLSIVAKPAMAAHGASYAGCYDSYPTYSYYPQRTARVAYYPARRHSYSHYGRSRYYGGHYGGHYGRHYGGHYGGHGIGFSSGNFSLFLGH